MSRNVADARNELRSLVVHPGSKTTSLAITRWNCRRRGVTWSLHRANAWGTPRVERARTNASLARIRQAFSLPQTVDAPRVLTTMFFVLLFRPRASDGTDKAACKPASSVCRFSASLSPCCSTAAHGSPRSAFRTRPRPARRPVLVTGDCPSGAPCTCTTRL